MMNLPIFLKYSNCIRAKNYTEISYKNNLEYYKNICLVDNLKRYHNFDNLKIIKILRNIILHYHRYNVIYVIYYNILYSITIKRALFIIAYNIIQQLINNDTIYEIQHRSLM